MIKKIIVILSLVFVLSPVYRVRAHTFLTDGNITVLLHTNPDDDPIVGQSAAVLFQITDSTDKFDSSRCDCSVAVSKDNTVLVDSPLLHVVGASVYDLTVPVIFPQKGVYQISVTGKPKVAGMFQSFKVEYDLRVDRESGEPPSDTSAASNNSKPLFIGGSLAILAVIVGVVIYLKRIK